MRHILPWLFPALLFAAPVPAQQRGLDAELADFVAEMAERHGFATTELERLFSRAQFRPEIIEAMERPREALPWHEYRKIFVTPEHVRQGLAFWQRHADTLARAEVELGVPPQVIVAILGIESRYGRSQGRYSVLDALATLTVGYPRRAGFFRRELEAFLLLTRETGLDPLSLRGSYAGAIGVPQFMPSSYRQYAVDFDGDGRRDLLNSPADIIGSVANFLKQHGWQRGVPVSDQVRLDGTRHFWIERLGIRPLLSLNKLLHFGIIAPDHHDPEQRAALIALEGEDGPIYRLGFQNFYVITRYNRSARYAMAVHELSEWLRHERENAS